MKKTTAFRTTFAAACACAGIAALAPATANAQAHTFAFSASRPKLVILMAGVTQKPTEAPEKGIGGTKHARYYWGYDFIKALQGRLDENQMRVITPRTDGTMNFKTNINTDWLPSAFNPTSGEVAPICYPVSWFTNLPAGIENNTATIKEYISVMTPRGTNAPTMVMVSCRDGSKHLMPQLAEFIDETFIAYKTAYGHLPEDRQPQIYMVGHSFGGVIARALMANPSGKDLFGNSLTLVQRSRADFLRSRVMLVHSLSSPHEGTHISRVAGDTADFLDNDGRKLLTNILNTFTWSPWKGQSEAWVKQTVNDFVSTALDSVSGRRDCHADLLRMSEYNAGILHPNTMRRPDGSFVPIYTASGRNPGNNHYNRSRSVFLLGGNQWNPISNIDIARKGNKAARESMALHLIEALMRREGYGRAVGRPWGVATNANGDRVRSPFAYEGRSTLRGPGEKLVLDTSDVRYVVDKFLGGAPYVFGNSDGEWDNDGFLGWDSGNALNLTGSHWYRVFHPHWYGGLMPWDNDNHGSLMSNVGTGMWIHNELIREAGPYTFLAPARRSTWSNLDGPATPSKTIRIDFSELADVDRNLDYASGADFTMTVRAGSTQSTVNLPDGNDVVKVIPSFTLTNYASTVIPVRIDVLERDNPSPDPHDFCVLSPRNMQDALFFYIDTRTGRIAGDVTGIVGSTITARPYWDVANKVQLKFKVTVVK